MIFLTIRESTNSQSRTIAITIAQNEKKLIERFAAIDSALCNINWLGNPKAEEMSSEEPIRLTPSYISNT